MTGNDQLGPSILSLVAVICSLRCHWKLEVCHHWRVAVRCGTAGACVGSGPCAIKGGVDCQSLSVGHLGRFLFLNTASEEIFNAQQGTHRGRLFAVSYPLSSGSYVCCSVEACHHSSEVR